MRTILIALSLVIPATLTACVIQQPVDGDTTGSSSSSSSSGGGSGQCGSMEECPAAGTSCDGNTIVTCAEMDGCLKKTTEDCATKVGAGSSCAVDPETQQASCSQPPMGTAMVRFVDASDGTPVSLYIDNDVNSMAELFFSQCTKWISVPAGKHTFRVAAQGVGWENAVAAVDVDFQVDHKYSVGVMGVAVDEASLSVIEHDITGIAPDNTRITVVNARPGQKTDLILPVINYVQLGNTQGFDFLYMGMQTTPYGKVTTPKDIPPAPAGANAKVIGQYGDGANPPIEQSIWDVTGQLPKGDAQDYYFTEDAQGSFLLIQDSDGSCHTTKKDQ